MTSSKMLTQEEIDAGLREAEAAVAHGREVLERSRARCAELGITQEKVRQLVGEMSPHSQLWVNTLVSLGRAKLQPPAHTPAIKAALRKHRVMV